MAAEMALRRAQEPTIASLSDDLLAKCFASLGQKDRLSRAALVSRRWHAVSMRPELQQRLVFEAPAEPSKALPAAQSLFCWMRRHGAAVRSLRIKSWNLRQYSGLKKAEIVSVLDGCLILCSSGLEKLALTLGVQYSFGGWAAAAPRLQELRIFSAALHAWFPLSVMTALNRLKVNTADWQLGISVQLPPSLTRLHTFAHRALQMPRQVAALSNLRSLKLEGVSYSAASMASLTLLSSLQHASLRACQLPDSLPQLTGLRALEIDGPRGEAAAVSATLDGALRQLTQLTGLWLPVGLFSQPPLSTLSSLRWLYFDSQDSPLAALPLGHWHCSLEHLVVRFPLALSSLPFLRSAVRLQRLSLLKAPFLKPGEDQQWQAFWRWAGQHEALQRIDFIDTGDDDIKLATLGAIIELKERRPELRIDPSLCRYTLQFELLGEWDN